jgi:O-antigen/teichoic acid export membrane protein
MLVLKRIFPLIKRAIKTDFVKISTWSAASTFIRMIASFVSIKVVAKLIGPSGIALIGQFMNSIALISALSTGFISQGVTKYVAENYDNPEKQKKVIGNAFQITLFSTLLVCLLVMIFHHQLAYFIFQNNKYDGLIIILGISLSLYSLNTLLLSILNGLKLFRKFTIINITISIVTLGISVLLVIWKGLYGALLNCIVSQAAIVLITIFYVRKEPWLKWVFSRKDIDWQIIKKLGGFVVMTIVASMLAPYVQIFIRQQITKNISLDAAGLWEGMNRISTMYLLVITTSISTYYLPRLSEIKDPYFLKREIQKTSAIVLPVLAVVCFCIFLFRDIIIRIIFSHEFSGMGDLFGPQMLGDFLRIASWLVAMLFWAKAMTRLFIITEITFNLIYIFLVRIMVPEFGLVGSSYAYAITYLLYLVVVLFLFKKILFNARKSN